MSIKKMTQVWECSQLGGTELLLLLAIADFADDSGEAWPSVETLAKKIRMSKRNANYLLAKIAKTGELTIEINKGPRGCNRFRVQTLQGENFAPLKPVAQTPEVGSSKPLKPASVEPSVNHQETVNRARSAARDEDPLGFSECWTAYPKRAGGNSRKEAAKAYRARLKAGALPADLLSGVQRYATFVRASGKEGSAYVKQAATFFGPGEHWREPWDIPAMPHAAGGRVVTAANNPFGGAI